MTRILPPPSLAPSASRLHALTPSTSAARPAPSWHNTSWLNTDKPLTLSSLKGKVVLLNFWTFTCYNCTNTVPSLVDFDARFREKGLVHHRDARSRVPAERRRA